jgi:signal peptide peptidase SppA
MKKKGALMKLSTRIINVPLMIQPDKLNIILSIVGPRIGLDIEEIQAAQVVDLDEDQEKEEMIVADDLAIIPVHGTLVQRVSGLDAMSGLISYEDVRKDIRAGLDDPSVRGIVLDIDSPGGEVAGAFDLADEIYRARGIKPIFAVANESAYSAAYLIASAAGKIYLPRTAGMGSIGVIAIHVDQSRYDEKEGVKFTAIYAGSHKNDFSMHQPLADQAKETIQAEINEVYDLFVETVARNRDIKTEAVRAQEAGIYQAGHAVEAGLADEVMSWDEVISDIKLTIIKGGKNMKLTLEQLEKEAPEILGEIRTTAVAGITVENFKDEIQTRIDKAVGDERARIMGVFKEAYGEESAGEFASVVKPGATTQDMMRFAQLKAKMEILAKMTAEAPETLGVGADLEEEITAAPEGEEKWRKEYAKSADIRTEFGDVERYIAFKKAESEGKVKILRSKAAQTD